MMSTFHGEIGVIGAGGWGTALAMVLAGKTARVRLWAHRPEHVQALRRDRCNEPYLPGHQLPEVIEPTDNPEDLAACRLLLFVPPSKALPELARRFAELPFSQPPIVMSATKGMEFSTGRRMSEVLAEAFPDHPLAVLSGPNHAEEVAAGAPTATVIGSEDMELAATLQELFSNETFRAYRSTDVAGIELGGALKNIYALAAGISDGLGLGDNTKAALITRALAELVRIGVQLGGRPATFQGLSGIGDLMVTCFSRHSRNRRVGEALGRGQSLAGIEKEMAMVAEGVPTTRAVHRVVGKEGIDAPILEQVHAILQGETGPSEAMRILLERDLKPEAENLRP